MNEQADPATEFAKELARQLPVKSIYDDAAAPAAKQTGQLLQDVIKALQLALAPVQLLGALQDRFRNFLDASVRAVPIERRISPAPQIIGPVFEGIRYEPEGTPIDEMFSRLLSRAMDKERASEAHPAYPILIRQLSSDEAQILASLNERQFNHVVTLDYDRATNLFANQKIEVEFPKDNLLFPENIGFYFQHLHTLGLAGIYQEGNQEPIKDGSGQQIGVRIRSKYKLTEFGEKFVRACIG